MSFQILSVPYHMGTALPFDLTIEPHLRIEMADRERFSLSSEPSSITEVGLAIRDAVHEVISGGFIPFLWAGDCMAPISVVTALQCAGIDPTIMWFDAHGDFNTPETSWTGYLPGMSLAMLVGLGDQHFLTEMGTRVVSEDKVILVDGRHLDPKEAELISGSRISHVSIDSVDAGLINTHSPLYLHIDVDVVDPRDMPAMRWAAVNGPSIDKVLEAVTRVVLANRICAVSVGITLEDNHPDAVRAIASASVFRNALSLAIIGQTL